MTWLASVVAAYEAMANADAHLAHVPSGELVSIVRPKPPSGRGRWTAGRRPRSPHTPAATFAGSSLSHPQHQEGQRNQSYQEQKHRGLAHNQQFHGPTPGAPVAAGCRGTSRMVTIRTAVKRIDLSRAVLFAIPGHGGTNEPADRLRGERS